MSLVLLNAVKLGTHIHNSGDTLPPELVVAAKSVGGRVVDTATYPTIVPFLALAYTERLQGRGDIADAIIVANVMPIVTGIVDGSGNLAVSGTATATGGFITVGISQAGSFTSAPGFDLNITPGPYPFPSGATQRNLILNLGNGNPTHSYQTGAFVLQTPNGIAVDNHGSGADALTAVVQVGTGPAVTMTGTPTGYLNMLVTMTLGGIVGTSQFTTTVDGVTSAPQATAASVLIAGTGTTVLFAAGTYVLNTTYAQTVDIRVNQWFVKYNGTPQGWPYNIAVDTSYYGGWTFDALNAAGNYTSINGYSNGLFLFRLFDVTNSLPAMEVKIQGTARSVAFGGVPDVNQDNAIQLAAATPAAANSPAAGQGWFWFDAAGNLTLSNSSGLSVIHARPSVSGAGKVLELGGSAGTTPGTDSAGGCKINAGALVSNQSAQFSVEAPLGTPIFSAKQTSVGVTTLGSGTNNLTITSGSATSFTCATLGATCSTYFNPEGADIYLDGKTHFRNAAGSTTLGTLDGVASSFVFNTTNFGAFGATPVAKQNVTGSRASGAALVSLIAAWVALGFITDSTST